MLKIFWKTVKCQKNKVCLYTNSGKTAQWVGPRLWIPPWPSLWQSLLKLLLRQGINYGLWRQFVVSFIYMFLSWNSTCIKSFTSLSESRCFETTSNFLKVLVWRIPPCTTTESILGFSVRCPWRLSLPLFQAREVLHPEGARIAGPNHRPVQSASLSPNYSPKEKNGLREIF